MRKDYIGFGFNPVESENHFYVVIPSTQAMDDRIGFIGKRKASRKYYARIFLNSNYPGINGK